MTFVVFSDEELRKKYDVYGEEGLKDDHFGGGHYQSWNYFNEEFGKLAVLFAALEPVSLEANQYLQPDIDGLITPCINESFVNLLVPVVQRAYNFIQWISRHPADKVVEHSPSTNVARV